MKLNRKVTFRILTVLEIIVIITLVFSGRSIERGLNQFLVTVPLLRELLAPLIVLLALPLISYLGIKAVSIAVLTVVAFAPLPIELSHLALFGLLAYLLCGSEFGSVASSSYILPIMLANGVSLLDELLQAIHPERFFDLRDLGLNLIGTMIGALVWHDACSRDASSKDAGFAIAWWAEGERRQ